MVQFQKPKKVGVEIQKLICEFLLIFFFLCICQIFVFYPVLVLSCPQYHFFMCQMPVQGPSQTFRDGFSMVGMSQVFIVLCICNCIYVCSILDFHLFQCLSTIIRNSWVMTSKAKDHMFLKMLLNFPLRYMSGKSQYSYILGHIYCILRSVWMYLILITYWKLWDV